MTTAMRELFTYTHENYKKYKTSHTWFYFKKWRFSLLVPPKCGSSSIKQFIWMNELENDVMMIQHHQATEKMYVVIRNPVSRFASLWRSKCRDQANLKDKRVYGMSPTELMAHIESGAKDVHWTKQTDMIVNLDVNLIPLSLFGFWWQQSGFGELGKFNTTEGDIDIDDSLNARILTFYADDVILHNRAESEFCQDKLKPQLKQ